MNKWLNTARAAAALVLVGRKNLARRREIEALEEEAIRNVRAMYRRQAEDMRALGVPDAAVPAEPVPAAADD